MTAKRVVSAAVVGSVVEFYDFALFGLAAALIFNDQFFPASSPVAGTLGSMAAFAVGFLARPIGGAVFSHFGDRVGRKPMLAATLLLMGISTAGMGLLPTYETAGVLAPILLVVLRLAQGFGAGAEYAGALVVAAEASEPRRRGLWASLPGMGVAIGMLLATLVFTAVSALPDFHTWAWRLPFLLSLVGVGVGLYVRSRLPESEVFERERRRGRSRFPMLEVLRRQPRSVLVAFFANAPFSAMGYIIQVFVLSYVSRTLGVSATVALIANLASSGLSIVTGPLFGLLSDRVGRRPVYLGGALFLLLFSFPMFWLLDTGHPVLIVLSVALAYGVGISALFAAQAALFAELFDTRYRYSGVAVVREWAAALVSGPAPLVATALAAAAGGASWPIAILMAGCALVCFTAVALAPETRDRDLNEPAGPVLPPLQKERLSRR
ncbi:MHS family MFS transporter [Herbidospora galbida]|uniref:MHS family MFS transporter n=1 Tax=Herbidospora galbida TaxID=2575442 RepID=A0A4U3MB31_9ACTN|nr:MFS transporter [Herbidospora galbida]TKK86201.1 MHS family MFS transporter [Herbidospora galbida]